MNTVKLTVKFTAAFKKDYKRAMRRGADITLPDSLITLLAKGMPLPARHRDHELTGNWKGFREYHVQPDWLPVYRIENNVLVLTLARTGTHSDIF